MKTLFYETDHNATPIVSIIAARLEGKWLFCRHADHQGWELPGGHIEPGETAEAAARRELWEETGVTKAAFTPVNLFSVGNFWGMLFFAEVEEMGALPSGSEIAEVMLNQFLPTEHAYHNLPELFDRVQNWLNIRSGADELWDVYDCHRNPTGRLQRRGDPIPAGDHHIVVHAFVRCTDGRYLITKRSPNKGFPLMWETTGGSALAGEDSLTAALREVREETGIQVDPSQAQLVTTRPWIDHFDDIWLFRADFSLEDVTLLEGETCDACLATAEEIVRLWHRGEFVPTDALDQLLDLVETL